MGRNVIYYPAKRRQTSSAGSHPGDVQPREMSIRVEKQIHQKKYEIRRNKTIQTKVKAKEPEIMWNLNVSEDGKSFQENYMLLFPRYVSAIDDE